MGEHFLDAWTDLNDLNELLEKLDVYEILRVNPVNTKVVEICHKNKNWSKPKKTVPSSSSNKTFQNLSFYPKRTTPSDSAKANPSPQIEDCPTLKCYGCGAPGFIHAKCPSCSLVIKLNLLISNKSKYTHAQPQPHI